MQEKLSTIGGVYAKLKDLEDEKTDMHRALLESSEINEKLKGLLDQKDKVIEKMQTEMDKFIAIKNEVTPMFRESADMKKAILEKDQQIEILKAELTQATRVVEQLPNIEVYVKKASEAIKTMGEENERLKEQVSYCNQASRDRQGK